MTAPATAQEIRDVNTRYHDVAATGYDYKWGIDFGPIGANQVLGKLHKALGEGPTSFQRSLEIGAGTGYFTLNMLRAGVVDRATATDISPGMLKTLRKHARELDLKVTTRVADAEQLPFGHAVLHHIPDLGRAFAEFLRVLRPGGTLLFAGEPSRHGDRLAALPKNAAGRAAPLWRMLVRAQPAPASDGHFHDGQLEGLVDVHAFSPGELQRFAGDAGFEQVRVSGEELLANWFGWANRTLEATAEPTSVPWLWRQYAYRGYLLLQALDRRLLEPRLPAAVFYNLIVCARRPPKASRSKT
jgi:SAM-dependent methyltransferase